MAEARWRGLGSNSGCYSRYVPREPWPWSAAMQWTLGPGVGTGEVGRTVISVEVRKLQLFCGVPSPPPPLPRPPISL